MRHHFWEWPIPTYLFLGGLGGGIFCLIAILSMCVYPNEAIIPELLVWPSFIAILALGFGCLMLVVDLGQPMVFYRAFVKSTSVLAWGARLLTVCMIFGLIWFVSYLPRDVQGTLPCYRRYRRYLHYALHRYLPVHSEGSCFLGNSGASGAVHRISAFNRLRCYHAVSWLVAF